MQPLARRSTANSGDSEALAALVRAAQGGDPSAVEALARRFLRPAYLVALSVVLRPADAEDVAQEALIRALAKIETCRQPAAFAGWLMQIVRNQARNALGRRRLRDVPAGEERELADETPTDSGSLPGARRRLLLAALTDLSKTEREVVLLHDLEGYTHAEIASALGLSTVGSRQHLFVARTKLRRRLGEAQS